MQLTQEICLLHQRLAINVDENKKKKPKKKEKKKKSKGMIPKKKGYWYQLIFFDSGESGFSLSLFSPHFVIKGTMVLCP